MRRPTRCRRSAFGGAFFLSTAGATDDVFETPSDDIDNNFLLFLTGVNARCQCGLASSGVAGIAEMHILATIGRVIASGVLFVFLMSVLSAGVFYSNQTRYDVFAYANKNKEYITQECLDEGAFDKNSFEAARIVSLYSVKYKYKLDALCARTHLIPSELDPFIEILDTFVRLPPRSMFWDIWYLGDNWRVYAPLKVIAGTLTPQERFDENTIVRFSKAQGSTLRVVFESDLREDTLPSSFITRAVRTTCYGESTGALIKAGANFEQSFVRPDGKEMGVVRANRKICGF